MQNARNAGVLGVGALSIFSGIYSCAPAETPVVIAVPVAQSGSAVAPLPKPLGNTPKPAAVGDPQTVDALVDVVIQALRDRDVPRMMGLYATPAEVSAACPALEAGKRDSYTEHYAELEKVVRTRMEVCFTTIDWGAAEIVKRSGGEVRDPVKECPAVRKVRDVKIVVKSRGRVAKLVLDDPALWEGHGMMLVDENPRCSEDDDDDPASTPPMPAPVP